MNAKKISLALASLAMVGTTAANAASTLDQYSAVVGGSGSATGATILSQPAVIGAPMVGVCGTNACTNTGKIDEIPVTLEQHAVLKADPALCKGGGLFSRLLHPGQPWLSTNLFGWGVDAGGGRFFGFTGPYRADAVSVGRPTGRVMANSAILGGCNTACAPGAVVTSMPAVLGQTALIGQTSVQPAPYKISPEPMLDLQLFKRNIFGWGYQVPAFQDMRLQKVQLTGQ